MVPSQSMATESCGGIGFAVIKSGDAFPVRRNLKVRITDDDSIGTAVQGLREYQLAPAGLMNDFLFTVPSCLGAVLQTLALSPIGVSLRVGSVVNPANQNPGARAAS